MDLKQIIEEKRAAEREARRQAAEQATQQAKSEELFRQHKAVLRQEEDRMSLQRQSESEENPPKPISFSDLVAKKRKRPGRTCIPRSQLLLTSPQIRTTNQQNCLSTPILHNLLDLQRKLRHPALPTALPVPLNTMKSQQLQDLHSRLPRRALARRLSIPISKSWIRAGSRQNGTPKWT